MAAQITVRNALEVRGGSKELVRALKDATTHANPDYGKKRAMGHWVGSTPRRVATWDEEAGALLLPRGASGRVRDAAALLGERVVFRDARVSHPATWPAFVPDPDDLSVGMRPYQLRAEDACVLREQGIVRAPTGCLAGDTLIGINRAGKSFQIRIDELVRMENGGRAVRSRRRDGSVVDCAWDPTIQTMVRAMGDGFVELRPLRAAYRSGMQRVFTVTMESGHLVRATGAHQFLTPGGWRRLDCLAVGDAVLVEGERKQHSPKRNLYRVISGLRFHPYAGRRGVKPGKGGWSVPVHRLVVEAALNGRTLEEHFELLRTQATADTFFIDPAVWVVHHVDDDSLNNSLENLALMLHAAHRRLHAPANTRNVQVPVIESRVASITEGDVEETYDLALDYPHNFLANGIVVHNSGKTHVALRAFARIGQRTLVIVRDRQLLEQWLRKARKHLGMEARQVGVVQGSKRQRIGDCLTLALQQTLWAKNFPLDTFAQQFGCVAVDEVQGAAARTVQTTIAAFPARYRLGFSADETRKDRKEFLVYDLFGSVIYEVTREEIERDGYTCPVIVRLVPTEFRANWYRDAPPEERDFGRLVEEMIADESRGLLLRRVILELVKERDVPAFVFTHRREHASRLSTDLLADGIACGLMMGGEESAATFAEARELLERGKLLVAVGTFNAIGQGIDVPGLRAGVVGTPLGANRQFFGQVRGRICRSAPGKTVGHLYYLWDREVFPRAPRNLIEWNDGLVEIFDRERSKWIDADEEGEAAW